MLYSPNNKYSNIADYQRTLVYPFFGDTNILQTIQNAFTVPPKGLTLKSCVLIILFMSFCYEIISPLFRTIFILSFHRHFSAIKVYQIFSNCYQYKRFEKRDSKFILCSLENMCVIEERIDQICDVEIAACRLVVSAQRVPFRSPAVDDKPQWNIIFARLNMCGRLVKGGIILARKKHLFQSGISKLKLFLPLAFPLILSRL